MPIKKQESIAREMVDVIHKNVKPKAVTSLETIRQQAIAQFTKELDGKLANLQEGETLLLTYRVDIVGKNGDIRGGSGSQRTMPEYIEWRTAVYERDEYTCCDCGQVGGALNAHHIKSWEQYPSLRFDVDNGMTLCEACHAERHPHLKMIGSKNNGKATENGG